MGTGMKVRGISFVRWSWLCYGHFVYLRSHSGSIKPMARRLFAQLINIFGFKKLTSFADPADSDCHESTSHNS